jgi:hypothetical protein
LVAKFARKRQCPWDNDTGKVNVTVFDCPGNTWWLALTSSILTLCWPTGNPAMSIVLLSLGSAPPPRKVVNGDVQVSDPRRYAEGSLPEHGYDAHVLCPVLDPNYSLGQTCRKRCVHDQFGWRLVLNGEYDVAPRTSFALRGLGSASVRAEVWVQKATAPAINTSNIKAIRFIMRLLFKMRYPTYCWGNPIESDRIARFGTSA